MDDYKLFNALHTKRTLRIISLLYFVLIFLVFAWTTSSGLENALDVVIVTVFNLIFSSVATLLLFLLAKVVLRWRGIKEFKSDQLMKRDYTYHFDENGITQIRGRSTSYFEWTDILKVQGQKRIFLIYLSKNKAIPLPERFFKSQMDMDSFKKVVTENMDSKNIHFK
ncbi:YcxB family protein [Rossellomorea aquimaris]|uniref:YcxB family protein n=1 Tax=Rossellomorea aquimaris TaxID=189382 RepID=UPI0005CAC5E5|nr:YcxB family protein [Rossellomorea aquimaris]